MAAAEWLDEHNLAWLLSPPKIKLVKVDDAHEPYPLSWDEQSRLFQELPSTWCGWRCSRSTPVVVIRKYAD